mgnify:CR=1 FL=1
MLQSMTGFGRGEDKSDSFQVFVEIKSVNNRFKDFRFKMSSLLNPLEASFKSSISNEMKRGSFEVSINLKKLKVNNQFFSIDHEKVKKYVEELSIIKDKNDLSISFNATDFLRNEFQEEVDQENILENIKPSLEKAFNLALTNLKSTRLLEGDKIKNVLLKYVNNFSKEFNEVSEGKELYRKGVEANLFEKLKEYDSKIQVDKQRLLQEVIYYLEKLDINEEVDRINFHLSSLKTLISSNGEEVGRKIDFLIQELNRETNTIGSKSGSKEISNHVVNMKTFLEKIREQGLNLQ